MLIYDILKKDHDKIKSLLTELIILDEGDEKWYSALIVQLREQIIPHSRAEEDVFYDAIHLHAKAKNVALHGYQEHLMIEYSLRTLLSKDKVDFDWKSTVMELKNIIENHLIEEENALFPIAKILFTDDEARMMGKDFLRLRSEFLQEIRGVSGPDKMLSNSQYSHSIRNADAKLKH